MNMLTRTKTVMHISDTRLIPPDTVPFDCQDPDASEGDVHRSHVLYLDKDVWLEMDEPLVITVTVELGDTLNEEATDGQEA